MTKLGKAEKKRRTVTATVAPARREEVVKRAARRVKAKAQINFRRDVRE